MLVKTPLSPHNIGIVTMRNPDVPHDEEAAMTGNIMKIDSATAWGTAHDPMPKLNRNRRETYQQTDCDDNCEVAVNIFGTIAVLIGIGVILWFIAFVAMHPCNPDMPCNVAD